MSRQLFRTRWSQTTDEQKATITDWCQRHPIISDAYWTKERYCDLYLCASPAEAEPWDGALRLVGKRHGRRQRGEPVLVVRLGLGR
jgi:hypothetical protein